MSTAALEPIVCEVEVALPAEKSFRLSRRFGFFGNQAARTMAMARLFVWHNLLQLRCES